MATPELPIQDPNLVVTSEDYRKAIKRPSAPGVRVLLTLVPSAVAYGLTNMVTGSIVVAVLAGVVALAFFANLIDWK